MAEHSNIEWTDATWNPITGCSVISPGCKACYAMKLAGSRLRTHPSRKGLTINAKGGPVWTGEVRLNEGWLRQPLEWSKPRRIFVCAHGDLFHESVPDAWIDRVFATMAASPRHTFQVLTKRAARMRAYLEAPDVVDRIRAELRKLDAECRAAAPGHCRRATAIDRAGWNAWAAEKNLELGNESSSWPLWPLSNVWLGVSAEDQVRANERIPELLATPAAVRFLSAEPLLGPIDLSDIDWVGGHFNALSLDGDSPADDDDFGDACLDWVIVGGENGPRPMHPDWARAIRDACSVAGVPFFFKQWGTWAAVHDRTRCRPEHLALDPAQRWPNGRWLTRTGEASREGERPVFMAPLGKNATKYSTLDGVVHRAMPEARP